MTELVLHPDVGVHIRRLIKEPSQAVLLIGPTGSGKLSLARHITAGVLGIKESKIDSYPYFLPVSPIDGKAIPIDTIRELQHFTALKTPAVKDINRVVIIEAAHLMTAEAQNALLKTLEEPPVDTMFILTASAADALLPTILSRVTLLHIVAPIAEQLRERLLDEFKANDIERALLVSGGLPGLTYALLTASQEHPLYEATIQARGLLRSSLYARLLLVDTLSKQKQLCQDITFILGQMAHMALLKNPGAAAKRWQAIMKAAYEASESLKGNTQTKLVLMKLMLEI